MINVTRFEKRKDGQWASVPWEFKATKQHYSWVISDLADDPTSYLSDDKHFSSKEKAEKEGLATLEQKDEGILQIWFHEEDEEGNGESGVVAEYRREKFGPSVTTKVK